MNFWQQIEPKSRNNITFQPRITHSCVVYKDQLLIFGGMRNLDDILDDLIVLQIKDDEEQSRAILSDTRKICSTCHFVFGLKEYVEQAKMCDKAVETDAFSFDPSFANNSGNKNALYGDDTDRKDASQLKNAEASLQGEASLIKHKSEDGGQKMELEKSQQQ